MEEAFVALINQHRGLIYKVCHLYGADRDYQEDLFQEIVMQIWRAYPSFRNEALITTWMYRIALNTAISYLRKEKRMPISQRISMRELQLPEMEQADDMEVLQQAIQQLTQVEKGIIMLYLDEKSYQEISDILGISLSNVGVKISRIKSKLEKIVKALDL
ncbi:RNA polymerase sigma factor [Pseudochryseolinea flava]|uniref:RNA polymerase subunit sigma-70 n=1 Tax=Pseudochryseolinea flava TaxID=2059302 RepID=A0A364Y7K9_9BACT|nr:sigma-70 family RNA polymerase sigma factor [Pseudochryseolinea flava]RAW02883.1 RNA polymerase subunit sigma-70 [Pseudochryseolinea flava]